MWLLAPGAALKRRPGWHLFYFILYQVGVPQSFFFNARWVGKHFFLLWVVGLNFYSKLCMVGADFFFFL